MIKVAIVCDTSGKDDEGMKKVARNLATLIDNFPGFNVTTIDTRDCLKLCSKFDFFHFIGGPSVKTIIVAFICRCFNTRLNTFLTFTNPFLGRSTLFLLGILKPTLCLVASKKWLDILCKLNVRAVMFNVSGVDTKKFSPVHQDRKGSLREKLNLPHDKIVVLHVGHLKEDRNLRALLPLQEDPDIQLVIVGSTTTKQSSEESLLLREAGCIVVSDYIPAIEEYYQASDCYIFPTLNPRAAIQVPLSILEALASGIPAVTTDFGGLKDTFGDFAGTLYYFKPDEFGILNMLVKNHLHQEVGREISSNSIDWQYIASGLATIYEE